MLCWSSLLYHEGGVTEIFALTITNLTTSQSKLCSYLDNKGKSRWADKDRILPDESREHRRPLDLWSKSSGKKTPLSSRSNPKRGFHCTLSGRTHHHTPNVEALGSCWNPSVSSPCNSWVFPRAACSSSPFLSVLLTRSNRTTTWPLPHPSLPVESRETASLLGLVARRPPQAMSAALHGHLEQTRLLSGIMIDLRGEGRPRIKPACWPAWP